METKQYKWVAIDIAIQLLRPGAKYTLTNTTFTEWDDPRPCPTWTEIEDTLQKIRDFEDSIKTLYIEDYLPKEQLA